MRISDWSSDVCSSDLRDGRLGRQRQTRPAFPGYPGKRHGLPARTGTRAAPPSQGGRCAGAGSNGEDGPSLESTSYTVAREIFRARKMPRRAEPQRHHHQCHPRRSEEHTSELQSLMPISYAVFCLKKNKTYHHHLTI